MFFNYTIIIDRILDIMWVIYLTTKKFNKKFFFNKIKEKKIALYVLHTHVHTLIARHSHWLLLVSNHTLIDCAVIII